ncbi:asparagine synthase (glutamine-hydrolyzing) [Magnetospirillum sp. SS-4]|uniref:asparagine synthase (glutamine-hydrolyzing) n=1 Tax=Magnetospirillum sp. SS-4 TaxID=2681465 RepID=UPI001382A5CE|nr:asparagine synthase (glutamine-hydrolyzing) [Magnetospirillum sp. SS-4]CAA7620706.1 Asparagine synthetase [Magnetospirillum sp. SS-4]
MCGIMGVLSLNGDPVLMPERRLEVMGRLLAHRGPDAAGTWVSADRRCGFGHRRLSVIDLGAGAAQPMTAPNGAVITYNGEIYNYRELRSTLAGHWNFRTNSDTETILAAYDRWGTDCVSHLRGMFAFAIRDGDTLFCAVDRFGIKPFQYATIDGVLHFASEAKALLPFLPEIATNDQALGEYLTFQYTLGAQTLFQGINRLMPAHAMVVERGHVRIWRYWDVDYQVDFDHSPAYFTRHLRELAEEAIHLHLRSDVPVGAYLSGGLDSSLVAILAGRQTAGRLQAFHGKFTCHPGYDESRHAERAAAAAGAGLHQIDITAADFEANIAKVIYHLDQPVAGPGSFPQFMVSGLARRHVKVVLGGQGGDEIFGGYARYLIAYFEQCIKAAIDGTYHNGNFVVTAESIIPNLTLLQEYKPLMSEFWRDGLFGPLDERYFRLIDRSVDMGDEIDWSGIDRPGVLARFKGLFASARIGPKASYFDSMTHFDVKGLLPALLHVEDRMSMAHGLESRVPLLDHRLIEFAAQIPADVKFKDGRTKHMLKSAFTDLLPTELAERRDKMGFPVPLKEWFSGELRDMVRGVLERGRCPVIDTKAALARFDKGARFSRAAWGLFSLELWHQTFHDRAAEFRAMMD